MSTVNGKRENERRRLTADERRGLVLAAATRAFARSGYAGTSTDTIAREAGVSQPYVVRIFGTKLDLFLDVLDGACERIRATFAGVLATPGFDPEDDAQWQWLGDAYVDLVLHDRDVLMVLMHGFAAGDSDEIAARARQGFGRIWATVMTSGCTEEKARDFIAYGMLLNVMLSMRAQEHPDEEGIGPLTACAFGEMLDDLTA